MGFKSTMIYILIFLSDSGVGKYLKVSKTNINKNGAVDLVSRKYAKHKVL